MRLIPLILLLVLVGCEDRYRYFCQDPNHFYAKQCQKPFCQFTQQCPEYLVAPILEKQTNVQPQEPASAPTPNR